MARPDLGRIGRAALERLFPQQAACAACRQLTARGRLLICRRCRERLPLVRPPHCPRCGMASASGELCRNCRRRDPLVAGGVALAIFDGQLRQLIHRVKFQGDRALARGLGQLLAECVRTRRWGAELVVPIPLDAGRLRLRGYNHAECIAQPVAAALGRPLAAEAIVRVRAAQPQSGLDLRARRANLRGVFWAPEPGRIRNRRVLLVDDVTTSGSTLDEAAAALLRAGARTVFAACVAVTVPGSDLAADPAPHRPLGKREAAP